MRRIVVALLLSLVSLPLLATTLTWTGGVDDRWSVAANWTPPAVPRTDDTLVFPVPVATVNDLDATTVIGSIQLSAAGDYTIGGSTVAVRNEILGPCDAKLTAALRDAQPWVLRIALANLDGSLSPTGSVEFSAPCRTVVHSSILGDSGGLMRLGYRRSDVVLTGDSPFAGRLRGGWSFEPPYGFEIDAEFPNATAVGTCFGTGTVRSLDSARVEPGARQGEISQLGVLKVRGTSTASSELIVQVNGNGASDQVALLEGGGPFSATLTLQVAPSYRPGWGDTFTVIDNRSSVPFPGALVQSAINLAEGAFVLDARTDSAFRLSYVGGDGNDVTLTCVDPSTVPTVTTVTGVGSLQSLQDICTNRRWVTVNARVTLADGRPAFGSATVYGGWIVPIVVGLHNGSIGVTSLSIGPAWLLAKVDYEGPLGRSTGYSEDVFLGPGRIESTIEAKPNPARSGEAVTFNLTLYTDIGDASLAHFYLDDREISPDWILVRAVGHDRFYTATFRTTLTGGSHRVGYYTYDPCNWGHSTTIIVKDDTATQFLSPLPTAGLPSQFKIAVSSVTSGRHPSGVVTLREGAQILSTAALDALGTAVLTGPPLHAGEQHTLTADYDLTDDPTFNRSSATIAYTVPVTPVQFSVDSSTAHAVYGQAVTFTVTADPRVKSPALLSAGRDTPVKLDLVDGKATWTTSAMAVGLHSVMVRCLDDCSGSGGTVQTVDPAAVTLSVAASPVTAAGEPTSLDVTASMASSPVPPSGGVNIEEDGRVLAKAVLAAGRATATVGPLPSGEHRLSIRYAGDANCLPADTAVLHTVLPPLLMGAPVSVTEGNEGVTRTALRVRLSGESLAPVSVTWTTADRTAVAGRDYLAASGTLAFAPGETAKDIELSVVGNLLPERPKSFAVLFANAANATLVSAETPVRIVNDDPFFTTYAGLAYGDAPEQTLDLHVPIAGDGPFPIIVGLEAHDFVAPDRECTFAVREAERGYAVAAISFRPGEAAPFPAQVQDVKSAVRWLRANAARYRLDPERIGVWGIGAGGHLAALLGTSGGTAQLEALDSNGGFSSRVQAVVDWFGEIDFAELDPAPPYVRYLGCVPQDCETAAAANAATYATPDDPPFLILHGAADRVVPAWNSGTLYAALRQQGVDVTFRIVDRLGHGGEGWDDPQLLELVDQFFDTHLALPRP